MIPISLLPHGMKINFIIFILDSILLLAIRSSNLSNYSTITSFSVQHHRINIHYSIRGTNAFYTCIKCSLAQENHHNHSLWIFWMFVVCIQCAMILQQHRAIVARKKTDDWKFFSCGRYKWETVSDRNFCEQNKRLGYKNRKIETFSLQNLWLTLQKSYMKHDRKNKHTFTLTYAGR